MGLLRALTVLLCHPDMSGLVLLYNPKDTPADLIMSPIPANFFWERQCPLLMT